MKASEMESSCSGSDCSTGTSGSKRRGRSAALGLLALAFTGCTVQYGQPRRVFAPPVLVPLEVDCVPATNGAPGLVITVITIVDTYPETLPGVTVQVRQQPSDGEIETIVSGFDGTVSLEIPEADTSLELTVMLHGFHPLRALFDARPGLTCTSRVVLEPAGDRILL